MRDIAGIGISISTDPDSALSPLERSYADALDSAYDKLLATAAPSDLPCRCYDSTLTWHYPESNHLTIVIPDECIRPLRVQLRNDEVCVERIESADSSAFRRCRFRLLQPGRSQSRLFRQGNILHLYGVREEDIRDMGEIVTSADTSTQLTPAVRLWGVYRPTQEYILAPGLLHTLLHEAINLFPDA